MPELVTALVVMPQERRSILLDHLRGIPARVLTASSCSELGDVLRKSPAVSLVLTDLALPDGSWFDVLNRVSDTRTDAEVVVCARLADERLWTQVLEAGGFDLLVEPYEVAELHRILDRAMAAHAPRLAAAS